MNKHIGLQSFVRLYIWTITCANSVSNLLVMDIVVASVMLEELKKLFKHRKLEVADVVRQGDPPPPLNKVPFMYMYGVCMLCMHTT